MSKDPQSSPVAGATTQRPTMTQAEMLDQVTRASGPSRPLRELRNVLPAARPHEMVDEHAEDTMDFDVPAGADTVAGDAIAPLTLRQRETLIDQAIVMLEDLYAHLPLKRALHAIDPIQRLRLLRLRHQAIDEREFQ